LVVGGFDVIAENGMNTHTTGTWRGTQYAVTKKNGMLREARGKHP